MTMVAKLERLCAMRFDSEKVTEAAALLLNLRGGKMHYIKLMKLLYLADREALQQWGIPISHDHYVSMDNGPVLTQTLNLIKEGGRFWSEHISAPFGDYEIQLCADMPQRKKLSRAEEKLLNVIYEQHGFANRWDLVDFVHTLKEWKNPHGSCIPIAIEDILEALEEPQENIEAIVSELGHARRAAKRVEAHA